MNFSKNLEGNTFGRDVLLQSAKFKQLEKGKNQEILEKSSYGPSLSKLNFSRLTSIDFLDEDEAKGFRE